MAKSFYKLQEPEREQVVRKLMEAGGSNRSVAEELGTKPNTIASYRNRKGIPSTNEAPKVGKRKKKPKAPTKLKPAAKPKETIAPPKPKVEAPTVLPAPKLAPLPKQDIAGLEEARSEASRCESKRTHCIYEAKPGSRFCPLHQDEESGARH